MPTKIYRKVKVGRNKWKNVVIRGVNPRDITKRAAKPYFDRINKVKGKVQSANKPALQKGVVSALDSALRYNHIKVKYNVPFLGSRTFFTRDLFTPTQVKQLRSQVKNLGHWLDQLPKRTDALRVKREMLTRLQKGTQGVLSKIGDAIDQGVQAQVPTITGISFTTALQGVSRARQRVVVTILRNGQTNGYKINFDFSTPAESARTLGGQFVASLK